MELSKRPKGEEIEAYVEDCLMAFGNNHEWMGHAPVIKRMDKATEESRRDLNLLMAHLKLEFKDIPGVPVKRVVGKATKKKAVNLTNNYTVYLSK